MNVLGVALNLPARVLSDLSDIARLAREVPERLDRIDARARAVENQIERALEVAEQMDRRLAHAIEIGESVVEMGGVANKHAVAMTEAAREVAVRGAEVAAALPTLERAVAIATPLEGTVERLGRIVDRLPGAPRREDPDN